MRCFLFLQPLSNAFLFFVLRQWVKLCKIIPISALNDYIELKNSILFWEINRASARNLRSGFLILVSHLSNVVMYGHMITFTISIKNSESITFKILHFSELTIGVWEERNCVRAFPGNTISPEVFGVMKYEVCKNIPALALYDSKFLSNWKNSCNYYTPTLHGPKYYYFTILELITLFWIMWLSFLIRYL